MCKMKEIGIGGEKILCFFQQVGVRGIDVYMDD